ncbi:vesicle-associated membrane protein 2 isoform X1 [Erinaceus europaeus]|uniref:Vesicle-associated membrane protein 2 isoform X1 n=2 Tax=Boreoeutheria TaxID=1437010 RepID=A0ABM3YH02_ERIEU|nr:vesicle-associated membrane protein 2 isoform X1 [Erinaceus europaeus]
MSATAATVPPAAPAGEGGPPAPPPNLTSNRRLQQTQAQVDEVVDIMRVNVDKVLERDQKLSELDDRADALQAGASQFETSAAKLKRKYWWKNLKMMIILGVICAIILIIIIAPEPGPESQSGGGSCHTPTTRLGLHHTLCHQRLALSHLRLRIGHIRCACADAGVLGKSVVKENPQLLGKQVAA